ncbi:MAG: hypothetical protein J5737_05855 [Bacteroidales bacterium]|nr:hypothetical protein [Bacteroidales bacterium]
MKRTLLFAMMLAAALFVSCEKNDTQKPSITWPSNESFYKAMELAPGADGAVSLSAPAGFESVTLTLNMNAYTVIANQYIDVTANKGSAKKGAVMDLIDDKSVVEFMAGLGTVTGSSLRGRTMLSLDLVAIINKLIEDQVVENNTDFLIDISIMDMAGQPANKTAKFHFTSAPSITWNGKTTFDPFDLTSNVPAKFKVLAPGKITQLKITLVEGVPEAQAFIKKTTTGGALTIDLINDAKAEESYKGYFPAAKDVDGKTEATLDFGFLFGITAKNWSAGMNVFTIYCKDANGKTGSIQAKFNNPEESD